MPRRTSFIAVLAALLAFGSSAAEARAQSSDRAEKAASAAEARTATSADAPVNSTAAARATSGAEAQASSTADVKVAPNGFLVRHEASVDAPPSAVWDALAGKVGEWWASSHTYSGDSKNLTIDARRGGCFCERLSGGGGVEHLRVVYVAPGEVLRMTGALGPLQASGLAGSLTWKLSSADGGATVELTYGVGGFVKGGFERIAPAVEGVLGEQLSRLVRFVETGDPKPSAEDRRDERI